MASADLKQPEKVVVFRFAGGPRDGQMSRSDDESVRGSFNEALAFWFTTQEGTVGRVFAGTSPRSHETFITKGAQAALDEAGGLLSVHRYQIVERKDTANEIVLKCDYRGVISPGK